MMGTGILSHPVTDGTATMVIAMNVVYRINGIPTGGVTNNAPITVMIGFGALNGNKAESGDSHH